MTYLQFLIIFIIPLVLLGSTYFKKSTYVEKKKVSEALALLIILAVVYTTPWDNYLVKTGVWTYEDKNILFRIGYVPFEEYLFFVLQSLMTGFWCLFILERHQLKYEKPNTSLFAQHMVTLILITTIIASLYFLNNDHTKYLGLILVWATPVVLLQWAVGGHYILQNRKVFLLCLLPPTAYLWLADSFALYKNIWSISTTQTIGLNFYNLPFEEALFFLSTNIMLCQGLILYVLLKDNYFKKPEENI